MLELIDGLIRLAVPLFCVSLAAVWFGRVGVINLALDGQMLLAAIGYVIGSLSGHAALAVAFACLLPMISGVALVYAKERLNFDVMLIGLGFLYLCNGASRLLCQLASGNPGYALLGPARLTEIPALVVACSSCIIVLLLETLLRPIRLAKVVGDSRGLAQLEGLQILKVSCLHAVVGGLLLGVAALFLVEHGGSFTGTVSGDRGFLALALVSISGTSGLRACAWSLLFALGQKAIYTLPATSELLQMTPYLLAVILLLNRRARRNDGGLAF